MYARMGTKSPASDLSDRGGHSGIEPGMNIGETGGIMVCMSRSLP